MPKMADLIHDAARFLDRTAADVKDRNLEVLLKSARTFARKNPVAVIAGAVFAGLIVSRFVKRSGRSTSPRRDNRNQVDPSYGLEVEGDYGIAAGRRYDDQMTWQTYEESEPRSNPRNIGASARTRVTDS